MSISRRRWLRLPRQAVEAARERGLAPVAAIRRQERRHRRLDDGRPGKLSAVGELANLPQQLERDLNITAEALALFVRFWLTTTPPLPNEAQAMAQAKGRERFEGFVEALGRRLQKGQSFLKEIPDDHSGAAARDFGRVDEE